MLLKSVLPFVLGLFLTLGAANAEIVVQAAPPRSLAERRIPSPAPGCVWTPGYHRWDGKAYVWTPGVWVRPPVRNAHWVGHRWVHRDDGWLFEEGHWR